jgi:hypothetical protein
MVSITFLHFHRVKRLDGLRRKSNSISLFQNAFVEDASCSVVPPLIMCTVKMLFVESLSHGCILTRRRRSDEWIGKAYSCRHCTGRSRSDGDFTSCARPAKSQLVCSL